MLRKIRIAAATVVFVAVTLLFLDFTGTWERGFGWLAKLQVVPAVLALNFIVIAVLVVMTLLFGRVYCSVICPLGMMQDGIISLRSKAAGKKARAGRFSYREPLTWVRLGFVALFVGLLFATPLFFASVLDPYSQYGRIAHNILGPVYDGANNLLAGWSEGAGNYMFYRVESPAFLLPTFLVALASILFVGAMAWFGGRIYCNSICPVGTVLGLLGRFSLFRPVIDTSKCNGCRSCERHCKSECISSKDHCIDLSRCVACMDCVSTCRQGAISYTLRRPKKAVDPSRRAFIGAGAVLAGAAAARAADKVTDGGLAEIVAKERPKDRRRVVPAGSFSVKNLVGHCTSCQLCISACPNHVLSPSLSIDTFMQPVMSFEEGACRPECTECSRVCPTGAIRAVDVAEKSSIQIGYATVTLATCLAATGREQCGTCARRCPSGAIVMTPIKAGDEEGPRMPVVNRSMCIGCGECEYICPVSPLSAIHVEGLEIHNRI